MPHERRPSQEIRVLQALRDAAGAYVDGMSFLHMQPAITQYHARIWKLQRLGYRIEGRTVEGKNWKEYRLVPQQQKIEYEQKLQTTSGAGDQQ